MTRFTKKIHGCTQAAAFMPAAILLTALALAGCAGGEAKSKPARISTSSISVPDAVQETPLSRALLAEINSRRPDAPLTADSVLSRAAAAHSKDMAARGYLNHHSPEGYGPLERVRAANPEFEGRVGENLGEFEFKPGDSDAQKAEYMVDKWMNSPNHAMHLRARNYTRTGIGLAQSGGKTYVTQLFTGP